MPPKSRRRVKQPEKKKLRQKQKQRQQQNVKVVVTQGGSGGGGAPIILPPQTPIQFRDTSGENVRLTGLIQSLENRIANFRPPVAQPVAPIEQPERVNPANDSATQTAVFNAPITYNDDLAEQVLREINDLNIKAKPIAEPPPAFNAPNNNNMSLGERIKAETNYEDLYEGQRGFKTPPPKAIPEIPDEPASDFLSMGSGYVGTPAEPFITRNGKWRADVSRADLERLAQDYGFATSGVDENGKAFKLNKEELKKIMGRRLGL